MRRLDFAVAVVSGEVDSNIVNRSISDMPVVPHVYDSDLCRARVTWAWSRRPEQIKFTPEAVAEILKLSAEMGSKYTSRIPLVEPADQRLKNSKIISCCCLCIFY